jgi:rubrerythrin
MAGFVTVADVIAAAVEIERRGYDFYERAKKEAASQESQEFFGFMAGEEQKHREIFASMLRRLGNAALPAGSSEEEYLSYVQASLDSHLLFIENAPIGDDPYIAALRFEKDTIIYFLFMLHLVPENEKRHIDRCIDEEKKHMALIQQKRKTRPARDASGGM